MRAYLNWVCVYLFVFITVVAHTPDNSFLGFVVEQHLNASDIKHIDDIKRQNQSLVYGKVDNFWKVNVPDTFMIFCGFWGGFYHLFWLNFWEISLLFDFSVNRLNHYIAEKKILKVFRVQLDTI